MKPPHEIHIATDTGDIAIAEDVLPTVTDAELAMLRLTRELLHELFAVGQKLMEGKTLSDRVRPVAYETLDGRSEVRLIRYSPSSDPLMRLPRRLKVQ